MSSELPHRPTGSLSNIDGLRFGSSWIGLVMSVFAAAAVISGYISIMLIIIAVLALFSFLEAFLKFCAGCKIFGLLIKLGLLKEEVCLDCVLPGGDGI